MQSQLVQGIMKENDVVVPKITKPIKANFGVRV